MCVAVPNFVAIGQTVAVLWRFDGFQDGGCRPSCILDNSIFLTAVKLMHVS